MTDMGKNGRRISFSITGETVTELVRKKLYGHDDLTGAMNYPN